MVMSAASVLIVLVAGGPLVGIPTTQRDASVAAPNVRLLELSSVRRLFNALAPQRTSAVEGERVAAWADVSLLVAAIVGDARAAQLAFDDLTGPLTSPQGPPVQATTEIIARDRSAYQLLALGYSSRETADVISGRISKQALDTARKMLMIGRGSEAVADYLDTQYRSVAAERNRLAVRRSGRTGTPSARFDEPIDKYARLHRVDAAIVRAVMEVESAFDPAARSRAGAIGLMQLTPATARALGVDPLVPEQNIEGGVRYLSELIQMFGGIDLALVAYNGGPGFARRYARGETALYGETREYVKRVLAAVQRSR
jgi:soluble lytic murein transglycosylase-like protein